jgi:hypothetical protein
MLEKCYTSPSQRLTYFICLIGFIISIIATILMSPMETYLKSISPYGVIELEFMWTISQAQRITTAWGSIGIQKELFVTYIDYLYIVGYVTFVSTLMILLVRTADQKGFFSASLRKWAMIGVLTIIFSALFDCIENINLIIVLLNPTQIQAINPAFASICASIKFLLLFITIVEGFSLIGWLIFGKKRDNNTTN